MTTALTRQLREVNSGVSRVAWKSKKSIVIPYIHVCYFNPNFALDDGPFHLPYSQSFGTNTLKPTPCTFLIQKLP